MKKRKTPYNECVNLTAYWLAVATLPYSQHAAGYANVRAHNSNMSVLEGITLAIAEL
jgi:hypothetical protein